MIIYFQLGKEHYRMRVAKVHVHPGDRDRVEKRVTDMTGGNGWFALPDGSMEVPSPEWIVRRALWATEVIGDGVMDLGKVR